MVLYTQVYTHDHTSGCNSWIDIPRHTCMERQEKYILEQSYIIYICIPNILDNISENIKANAKEAIKLINVEPINVD